MRYKVFTDGAASNEKNVAGCAYLILTETDYVQSESVQLKGLSNPTHAETISVGLAAAYFVDSVKLNPDDEIEFNTDCIAAMEFYREHAFNTGVIKSGTAEIIASVKIVRQLSKKCKIRFQKVKGHKKVINPNTYVDRLAKLAIRRE